MRRKKLLSAVVGMTMLLQLCVPVNASDEAVILTEETVVQTEQAGGEVTEQTGASGAEVTEQTGASGAEVTEQTGASGTETPEQTEILSADGEIVLEEEIETETKPEGETGQSEETENESSNEERKSDGEWTWDEELTLDLTDTAQMYTVEANQQRAGDHKHQIGGEEITFDTPLTNFKGLANGGNYYLDKDFSIRNMGNVTIPAGTVVNLCLNGHTISNGGLSTGFYIQISEGAMLNLCDCTGSGEIKGGKGNRTGHGGAVLNNGIFRMYGGTITDCGATSGTHKSHAVYSSTGGEFYLCGGSIKGNRSSDSGAGGYVYNGKFVMTGGTISGNSVTGNMSEGAGVCVKNAVFNMQGGTISGNTSSYRGGGVSVGADFDNSTATYKSATFTVSDNSTIEKNSARRGGAVSIGTGATVTMNGGVVRKNTATDESAGSAVYMMGGSYSPAAGKVVIGSAKLVINDGIIEKNECTNESGTGTIHLQGVSDLQMYGGVIRENTADAGGGIFAIRSQHDRPTVVELAGGTIAENEVVKYGGGLFINGAATTISGTTITGNTAGYGGGAYVYTNDIFKMTGGSVTGNQAENFAGGIYYEYNVKDSVHESGVSMPALLSGAPVIDGNTAAGQKDNLYIWGEHKLKVDGSLTDGASIGITLQNTPQAGKTAVFSEAADADYSGYFTSDDTEFSVGNDEANRLFLEKSAEYQLIYENMTEAKWQEGEDVPETYLSGHGLSELPTPVREGYRFDGWYDSENMLPEELVTEIGRKEKGDKTLWAKWSDVEAPVVTAELADGKDSQKWHSTASIAVSASDNGTPQPDVSVKTDNGEYQAIGEKKDSYVWEATQEGIHTYTFRAEDENGNMSETPALTVMLDKTAPVFGAVSFEGKTNEDGSWNIGENTRNAVVTIIEEHSGVSEISYIVEPEGGIAVSGTAAVKENRAQLPISEDFTGVIRVNCEDAAGHRAKELVLRAQKEELETETEPQPEPETEQTKKERGQAEASLRKSNTLTFKGKKLSVKWGKVKGADGYDIYAGVCGKEMELVKTVSSSEKRNAVIKKIGGKKIKKKSEYKVQVRAYRIINGEKTYIADGLSLHAVGSSNRSNTNVSRLKPAKNTYQIKKGKRIKLSVSAVKQNKKKKLLDEGHCAYLRYWSEDKRIASVNARGYITGKRKGTCYIYAAAQNGVVTKVKIKVK